MIVFEDVHNEVSKIHLKSKKKHRKMVDTNDVRIRLRVDAYNVLVDLSNETGQPINQIASEIIMQSLPLIVYESEEE